jgi:endonuclease/exonuclease/phosphatase family metal-dependent hydrolase
MSANCALFGLGDPTADIVMWDPDVVLIQDAWPYQVKRIADRLYEGHGDHRTHDTIGVITRWSIEREVRKPHQRAQQVTIVAPDGRKFEVVNIHLLSAATDLSLWRREVWRGHRINRAIRRDELSRVLSTLDDTVGFPGIPVVFGGDFNAPPGDPVSRLLDRDFEDAQLAAGAGWGNTYHRRFPILMIDRIHATRHFTAVRCATHVTRHSDHRFVVADLLLQPVPPVR